MGREPSPGTTARKNRDEAGEAMGKETCALAVSMIIIMVAIELRGGRGSRKRGIPFRV